MQKAPTDERRQLVPRWRSTMRTPVAERSNFRGVKGTPNLYLQSVGEIVEDWKERRSYDQAEELVFAAAVYGPSALLSPHLIEISRNELIPRTTRELAEQLTSRIEIGQLSLSLTVEGSQRAIYSQIQRCKRRMRIQPYNPMIYVEMARLYSRLGQVTKANKCFEIALGLSAEERYILRAAARFYVHIGNFQRATKTLMRGNPGDPWVQAALVSISELDNKPLRNLKAARSLLETDMSPDQLTELAGAIGTLEFGSGNVKRAKKYFKQGAVEPNDNMIAQIHWASKNHIVEFPESLLDEALTFEARTEFARRRKNWDDAIRHCADWMEDEPFSIRPACEGSYIAAEIFQDHQKSVEFCEIGLVANPDDVTLNNNIAYSLACLGRLDDAERFLQRAEGRATDQDDKLVCLATRGIIHFRMGESKRGKQLYEDAISQAIKSKRIGLAQRATVHYFVECARQGNFFTAQDIQQIRELMADKRIVEEAKDVYRSLLEPILLNHNVLEKSTDIPHSLLPKLVED